MLQSVSGWRTINISKGWGSRFDPLVFGFEYHQSHVSVQNRYAISILSYLT